MGESVNPRGTLYIRGRVEEHLLGSAPPSGICPPGGGWTHCNTVSPKPKSDRCPQKIILIILTATENSRLNNNVHPCLNLLLGHPCHTQAWSPIEMVQDDHCHPGIFAIARSPNTQALLLQNGRLKTDQKLFRFWISNDDFSKESESLLNLGTSASLLSVSRH